MVGTNQNVRQGGRFWHKPEQECKQGRGSGVQNRCSFIGRAGPPRTGLYGYAQNRLATSDHYKQASQITKAEDPLKNLYNSTWITKN